MALGNLIGEFLLFLGGGFVASFLAVRQSRLNRSYFLYHGIGALLTSAVGVAVAAGGAGAEASADRTSAYPGPQGLALAGFLASALAGTFTAVVRPGVSRAAFALAVTAFLGLLFVRTGGRPAAFANAALCSLTLGFSMAAMWLGHWYLVQPKLAIDELARVTAALLGVLGVRFVLGTVAAGLLLGAKTEAELYRYLLGHPGVFILMRWAWGLLAPVVFGAMVWSTVRIRSTQSATGILYVLLLSCLTGELLSLYLYHQFGLTL